MASGMSDFKKKKAEDEARQTGQLAPEVDVSSGKMINPHNPEFITKRPWYLGTSGPSLNHHAKQRTDAGLSMSEADEILQNRKKVLGRATSYRKGACENCGSMTHKKSECVERPRSLKKSAKVSGTDIAADEVVTNLEDHGKLTFDGKRDLWAGYRHDEFERIVERFNRIDDERKRAAMERRDKKFKERESKKKAKALAKELKIKDKLKAKAAAAKAAKGAAGENADEESDIESGSDQHDKTTDSADSDSDSDSDSDYDSDEEDDDEDQEFLQKDQDEKDFQGRVARQGGVGGAQMKTTVRNLRIREDTAKYLRNLDPNSAYYDPKTRSMRENPLPGKNPEEMAYAGDNYYRNTGDTVELARMQVFAIEAQDAQIDIHPEANPTAAILAKKRFEAEQVAEKEEQKKKILDQYGAEKFQKPVDARLRLGQTENWVEYSRDGRIVKGAAKAVVRSKYQEDVAVNNHTSVWGSFYDRRSGKWGYKCCHSTTRNSYCLGDEGKQQNDRSNSQLAESSYRPPVGEAAAEEEEGGAGAGAEANKSKLTAKLTSRSEVYGENLELNDLDEEKLQEALKKQKEFQKQKMETDDRKRKYNSMASVEVTKEDIEAYRMTKRHAEDPMAKMMDSDELLDG